MNRNLFKKFRDNHNSDGPAGYRVLDLTENDLVEFHGTIVSLSYCSILPNERNTYIRTMADILIAATSFLLQEFFLELLPSKVRKDVVATKGKKDRVKQHTTARQKTGKKSAKGASHNGNQAFTQKTIRDRSKKKTREKGSVFIANQAATKTEQELKTLESNQTAVIHEATLKREKRFYTGQPYMVGTDLNTRQIIVNAFRTQVLGQRAAKRVNNALKKIWAPEEPKLQMKLHPIGSVETPGEARESIRLQGDDRHRISIIAIGFGLLRTLFERLVRRVDNANLHEDDTPFEWEEIRALIDSQKYHSAMERYNLTQKTSDLYELLGLGDLTWLENCFVKSPGLAKWEKTVFYSVWEADDSRRSELESGEKPHAFLNTLLSCFAKLRQ